MWSSVAAAVVGRSLAGRVARAVAIGSALPVAAALAAPASAIPEAVVIAALAGGAPTVFGSILLIRRTFAEVQAELSRAQNGELLAVCSPTSSVAEVRAVARGIRALTEAYRGSVEQLAHHALHDPLTGLPNRSSFLSRLRATLRETGADEQVAVLLFDLDRFKHVNDTFGHAAGDRLLVVFSQRLRRLVAPHRLLARLAGDEFALLIRGPRARAEALACAQSILVACRRPFAVDGHELAATASVGVAIGEASRLTASELLRRADVALYRAKESGRARFAVFEPSWEEPRSDRFSLEVALRHAVQRGQLRLAYQPEFRLADGALVGFEALLRWHHPHRGVLPPREFIELAEESGEIVTIGRWVLERAVQYAAALNESLPSHDEPLVVSVNVSAPELAERAFPTLVRDALRRSKLDPACLRVEITETALVRDLRQAKSVVDALRDLGIRVAVDDFGTGYSSFTYLEALTVDALKIDRSFVRALGEHERARAIVEAIVRLGRGLGIPVTAEGIETRGQYELLQAIGCDYGQGHYFAPTMEPAEMEAYLAAHRRRRAV